MSEAEFQSLKDNLFEVLREHGAALCGAGDVSPFVDDGLTVGVAVAVPLPPSVVHDLQTAPTLEYRDQYSFLNAQLDGIVEAGASFLREQGFQADAHTCARTTYDDDWRTPLPHKTVATRAGLGWIGKSCLLVTPEYGGAVRLSSLVTDAPLPLDAPVTKSRCGACSLCVDACPGGALVGATWDPGMSREQLLRRETCKRTQIERMRAATGIDRDLCGLCFAVCPHTRRYLKAVLR